jgi:lipopolysaccharide export system permease protein
MGELYLFVLPELFFYTLPISFIIAAILTLYRLSNDNEMVVVFSLGISPTFLIRILAIPSLLLAILLLTDFVVVTPYIKSISKNFLAQKKAEAKFNLSASEFGHNFGDWMLFINKSDNVEHSYGDIVLFNKNLDQEVLLLAKNAELANNQGQLQLRLKNGEGYTYGDEIFRRMQYKMLTINDSITKDQVAYTNTRDYWLAAPVDQKYRNGLLVTNTLLSFFPLLSLFLIVALGVVHARHQKRWIYLWIFLSIVIYYAAAITVQKWLAFNAIFVVSFLWLVGTYFIYKRFVGNRF